jgi:hypothetical protein
MLLMLGSSVPSTSLAGPTSSSWIESQLLPRTYVESHGLTRAWHTQLAIDGKQTKIKKIKLKAGLLLVVTSDGVLHVVDAHTGVVNWITSVGEQRFKTLEAGANENYVATVNGNTLYIFERASGKLAYRHQIRGTAERGPVLTETRVLVPIVNGPLESYPLDADPDVDILGPQQLPKAGRMVSEPATFERSVVWGGDADRLFGQEFGQLSGEKERKFDTYIRFGINSGPVSFPPMAYIGTRAGFLVAYDQSRGERAWEFPAGSPIFHPPVALGNVVYALPQDGGMFAVKPETGEALWYASEPLQFAAASPQAVYTLDYRRRMAVIDAKTGARTAVFPLPEDLKPIINQETDRIYFYTDSGLIQCLHEQQLAEPHRYEPPKSGKPAKTSDNPFAAGADATTEQTPPAAEGDNPFGDNPMPGADPMQ